jgi:hypothetical protein
MKTGAGAHRDKKKEQKQGDFKHKKQGVAEGEDNWSSLYSPEAIKMGNYFIKEFNLTDEIDQQLAIEIVDNSLDGGLTDPKEIRKEVIKYLRQSGAIIKIRKKGVEEGSKEDDPFDQGWRTFFRRGDESDNPYAKGSPEYAQWLDGFQEGKAQPRHYESVAVSEKAPPGEKAERMVKHIKKGYAKDGGLSDKERSIAYATAWKHHNK